MSTQQIIDAWKENPKTELKCIGWTVGDGSGHEGYFVGEYFDENGNYLGPDEHGIEPILIEVFK